MDHSKKYTSLKYAQENGVIVPSMLYLTDYDLEKGCGAIVESFITTTASPQYIVRSAVVGEDGEKTSYAGYFKSSEAILPHDLLSTIQEIYAENIGRAEKIGIRKVHLIISPFIESVCGGVSFYPWLYFDQHMLVEISESPQAAVAGKNTTQILFSLDSELPHSPRDTGVLPDLERQLRDTFQKLRALFNFPIDVEWTFNGSQLYILQIRPITVSPTALEIHPLRKFSGIHKLEYDQYAETFGKLSRISFSLICELFQNASHYAETIGIKGGTPFLSRLPIGNIVTDTVLRDIYFSQRHWYSSFLRAASRHLIEQCLYDEASRFIPPTQISYEVAQHAFDRLQIAEVLNQTQRKPRSTYAQSGEYELTKKIDIDLYPTNSITNIWKRNFMLTLQPFRAKVAADSRYVFTDMSEFMSDDTNESLSRYAAELEGSTEGVAPEGDSSEGVELLYGEHVKGKCVYIPNPETWNADLPHGVIIITPYIPASWIPQIPFVRGFVCLHLGALSHAAIILRENKIPTIRVSDQIFTHLTVLEECFLDTQKIGEST